MVKKAKTKYLLRTIKKNGVPFFAVAFIAATSIAIIPVVVFYIIFQKHFVEGVSSASIKG